MWIFALLVAVPLIEIALFIKVGGWLTLWPTLGIVLATAVIGSALMRSQGRQVLNDLRRSAQGGGSPLPLLAHGALIVIAGILLVTPGFFTDSIGFLLLVPALRRALIKFVAAKVQIQRTGFEPPARDVVIDGEFIDLDTDPSQKPGTSGWTRH
ncbi:MAG: FxsA family protein [Paracoccaceae bacterium]|nr:FxsA family protein [Paracoccaceae bacterium]